MTANEAVASILALRELTETTGCNTRRTQSYLLASLPDDVLREVALRIKIQNPGPKNTHANASYLSR